MATVDGYIDAYDKLVELRNRLDRDMDYYDSDAQRPQQLKGRFERVSKAVLELRENIIDQMQSPRCWTCKESLPHYCGSCQRLWES
jgi:hypothetical protein